jgi:hypothetical protein
MSLHRWIKGVALAGVMLAVGGCFSERTGFLPNEDTALRKKDKEFVADATQRFPYKETAERGTTSARAEVDYMYRYIGVANLSDAQWKDVEVWVNKQYVVFVPAWKGEVLKRIQFTMLRDERGNPFTSDKGRNPVKSVEVFTDGKMYDIPLFLAE